MEKSYIVFDFETTGFSPKESTVIQLSAIRFDNGEKHSFNAFVRHSDPIPESAAAVHGITTELLMSEGVPALTAWRDFLEFLGSDLPLIGHNIVSFDVPFLEENCGRFEMRAPKRERYMDTAMMFKAKKMGRTGLQMQGESHWDWCKRISNARIFGLKYNLALCCDECGIDRTPFTAHRADGDVEMTNLIFKHYVGAIQTGSQAEKA